MNRGAQFNKTYRFLWARTCVIYYMHIFLFLWFCKCEIKYSNPNFDSNPKFFYQNMLICWYKYVDSIFKVFFNIGNKNVKQSRHLYIHKSLQRRVQNLVKYLGCFRALNTPLHLNLYSLKTCSVFSMNLIRLYITSENLEHLSCAKLAVLHFCEG